MLKYRCLSLNLTQLYSKKMEAHSSSDDEDVPELRRNIDEYNSSSSLDSSTPASKRKYSLVCENLMC